MNYFFITKDSELGFNVPEEVWNNSNLHLNEKILLAGLHNYINVHGKKSPTNDQMREFLSVSDKTIVSALRRLESMGYIERYSNGRNREIKVFIKD